MATRIDAIVNLINSSIVTKAALIGAKYYGIADVMRQGSDQNLYAFDDKGNEQSVFIDDTIPYLFYHKTEGRANIVTDYEQGFGSDAMVFYNQSLSMVFYSRNDERKSVQYFTERISQSLTDELIQSNRKTLKLQRGLIRMIGAEEDPDDIYSDEFPNSDFTMQITDVLLRINYEIQLVYLKSCEVWNESGTCLVPNPCPSITVINGGFESRQFKTINGLLNGGNCG